MLQVFGGMAQAGGFKQSMKEHRDHWKKQGDQINNIADGLDKDDPRPAYDHQQFPKMLYKPFRGEKGEKVVMNETEMAVAIEDGWTVEPYEFPAVAILDPATEKKALMDQVSAQSAMITQQNDLMQKMAARLEALEKGDKKKSKD